MTRIAFVNGPNLNLLGTREPEIYGSLSFEQWLEGLKTLYPAILFIISKSNVEGELINKLHELNTHGIPVVLNPGGYAHTSVALADAIAAISVPVVEVHISNVHAREQYRHTMLTAAKCKG